MSIKNEIEELTIRDLVVSQLQQVIKDFKDRQYDIYKYPKNHEHLTFMEFSDYVENLLK